MGRVSIPTCIWRRAPPPDRSRPPPRPTRTAIPGSNEPPARPAHGKPRLRGWDPLMGPAEPTHPSTPPLRGVAFGGAALIFGHHLMHEAHSCRLPCRCSRHPPVEDRGLVSRAWEANDSSLEYCGAPLLDETTGLVSRLGEPQVVVKGV